MIKINREDPPQNTSLDNKKARALNKVEKQIEDGEKKDFESLWSKIEVKKFLHEAQHGKCCFCERKRDSNGEIDVEHFRPKSAVKESGSHPGYWWLAYEWNNLFLACKTCNQQHKGTKFPLKDETKRAFSKNDNLENEEPYLINPLKEEPEDFIEYNIPEDDEEIRPIKAIGKCERGEETVNELTGINDESVIRERAEHLRTLRLVQRSGTTEDIKWYKDSSRTFAGFARFYFKSRGI